MGDETRAEYKLVDAKRKDMKALFDRMDKDELLYFLDPYKMKQLPPNHAKNMPDVANITLSDPLVYAQKAIAILGGASRQTVIEGEGLIDKKTTKLEQFVDDLFYSVNEWLGKRGLPTMEAFLNEQICLRGRIGGRSCLRLEDGIILPDALPLDTRFYVYELDYDGMAWGAPIFTRTKDRMAKDYGEEFAKKMRAKECEVVDFWDKEKNVVFADKQIVLEEENTWQYPPLIVSICSFGTTLMTEKAEEHKGEGIFWANRDLWSEKNRTATILQTLNINALFSGLQLETSKGVGAEKPASPFGARKVVPVEKGGGYKPIPVNDIKRATSLFYSVLESSIQRGSLAAIDYGNLTFPLSNIAITTLSSARNDMFLPRIQAIAAFYQALARMAIDQCKKLNESISLGKPRHENIYEPGDFEGDYEIKFRFFTSTKEQTLADLSTANAARGFLSDDTIRRDLMKLQDPDGEDVKFKSQQAENVDEVLFLFRRGEALLNVEKPSLSSQLEAFIIKDRIETILNQRRAMGALSPIEGQAKKEGEEQQAEGLLPAFPTGGGHPRSTVEVPGEPQEEREAESE